MIKFSDSFIQEIDNTLAWCEAEIKRIADEEVRDAEKKRKFHYSFWMAITPIIIKAKFN